MKRLVSKGLRAAWAAACLPAALAIAEEQPQPHGMISLNAILTGHASLNLDHEDQHRLRCGGDPCDSTLQFGSASLGVALLKFIDSTEVFQVGVGWEGTRYHWENNPYYTQTQFSEGWIQFAAQTTSFERWTWRSLAQVNVQTENWDIGGCGWFQGVIWGRYELTPNCNLHVGGLAMGGLRYGRIYPILGLEYAFPWDLNLRIIFPLEFSFTQQPKPTLRYGIAVRTFFGRNRFTESCQPCFAVQYCPDDCKNQECEGGCPPCCRNWPDPDNFCPCEGCVQHYSLHRGYIEYTNLGLEALLTWWPLFFTELTVTAGVCGTGELKLSDEMDHRRFSRYFDPTGYAQLSLNIYF